jgi:hypothetical protein
MHKSAYDFRIEDHGTIFLLCPITPKAEAWISEHIPEDAQRMGTAVAVEHRYIEDIAAGILEDGLNFYL